MVVVRARGLMSIGFPTLQVLRQFRRRTGKRYEGRMMYTSDVQDMRRSFHDHGADPARTRDAITAIVVLAADLTVLGAHVHCRRASGPAATGAIATVASATVAATATTCGRRTR